MRSWIYSLCFILTFLHGSLMGQCPTQNNKTWPKGATVYYSLGNIDPNSTEGQQIVAAMNIWSSANKNNNNSGVTFVLATAQTQAAVWTFNNGTTNMGTGATSSFTVVNGVVQSAQTTVGVNTMISSGVWFYSPLTNGYSTAFEKMALHEVGHSLGLVDVTGSSQIAGDTVMNQFSGTNDVGGQYRPESRHGSMRSGCRQFRHRV